MTNQTAEYMKKNPIFEYPFAKIYPLYLAKVEKKSRTEDELLEVLEWLTGYSPAQLRPGAKSDMALKDFFDQAPKLNPNRNLITGVICGVRVEEIEDPLMQEIRYMDKVVDELAKGKSLDKIKRQ